MDIAGILRLPGLGGTNKKEYMYTRQPRNQITETIGLQNSGLMKIVERWTTLVNIEEICWQFVDIM